MRKFLDRIVRIIPILHESQISIEKHKRETWEMSSRLKVKIGDSHIHFELGGSVAIRFTKM